MQIRELLADSPPGHLISLSPRAPGGQSARPGEQSVRSLEISLTASFLWGDIYTPRPPNAKYTCPTSEIESQAYSKHSKAPQSETLASPLQIFGLGFGLSKIQAW
jgi:hypothetical protein